MFLRKETAFLSREKSLRKNLSFHAGETPIVSNLNRQFSISQMLVKSMVDENAKARQERRNKRMTTTDKLAQQAKGIVDTERTSIDMNLGSYQAEKAFEEGIDPMDYIEPFKFSKRDFLIALFKEYNNLPIMKSLTNFAKVFNDVFIKELPVMDSYALLEMQIAEFSGMGTP